MEHMIAIEQIRNLDMHTIFSNCGNPEHSTDIDSRPIYIHYGSEKFDVDLFKKANTKRFIYGPWIKPTGGLWASRADSSCGWKNWTTENNMTCDFCTFCGFAFKLKPKTKIFNIKSKEDIKTLEKIGVYENYGYPDRFLYGINIDPLVKRGYDGIEVFMNDELYWYLYGWDCDSIILFNSDCIELIDKQGE